MNLDLLVKEIAARLEKAGISLTETQEVHLQKRLVAEYQYGRERILEALKITRQIGQKDAISPTIICKIIMHFLKRLDRAIAVNELSKNIQQEDIDKISFMLKMSMVSAAKIESEGCLLTIHHFFPFLSNGMNSAHQTAKTNGSTEFELFCVHYPFITDPIVAQMASLPLDLTARNEWENILNRLKKEYSRTLPVSRIKLFIRHPIILNTETYDHFFTGFPLDLNQVKFEMLKSRIQAEILKQEVHHINCIFYRLPRADDEIVENDEILERNSVESIVNALKLMHVNLQKKFRDELVANEFFLEYKPLARAVFIALPNSFKDGFIKSIQRRSQTFQLPNEEQTKLKRAELKNFARELQDSLQPEFNPSSPSVSNSTSTHFARVKTYAEAVKGSPPKMPKPESGRSKG